MVAGFCAILPVLGAAHPSLRPSEISSEPILSLGNAKPLLSCPIHIKNSNTSYIPVGDPSSETLPLGHHTYASHICCIQAYSAAVLDFRRFFFKWTACQTGTDGCSLPLCINTAFRLSFKETINSHLLWGSCMIPRAFIRSPTS